VSILTRLQRDLQDASAAVARAERVALRHPDVPSVAATLRTIQARQRSLEEQFQQAANEAGLDVCSYRIELNTTDHLSIAGMSAVLGTFQTLFTSVYDSLLKGAKKRIRVGAEAVAATELSFGYTFTGSVGFVMTLPNDKLLLGGTALDDAMKKTLLLIDAKSDDVVQQMVEDLGVGPVRAASQWAENNARNGYGADISWNGRNDQTQSSVRVQTQDLQHLSYMLNSATAREQIYYIGELLHVDMTAKTFQMQVNDRIIDGTFTRAISEDHPASIPHIYLATLTVNTKVALVDGAEQISYFLVSLDQPPQRGALGPVDLPSE
jgi:hypothetical protein